MPAGRILLKSISESKKLSELDTDGARLLFTWLIPHVDVNGCFSGDPEVIKGQIFTRLNKSVEEIEDYLVDLQQRKLIVRYETNGDVFLYMPSFVDKQPQLNPEREGKPRIPTPTPEQLKSKSRPTLDQFQTNSNTSKVKESKVNIYSPFLTFWDLWPNKVGRKQAEKAWSKLKLSDELLDEITRGLAKQLKEHRMRTDNGVWCPDWPNPATWINGERWKDEVEDIQDSGIHLGIEHDNTAVDEAREQLAKISPEQYEKNRAKLRELAGGATKKI